MNQPDLSIIIPSYNTKQLTLDCLASIYKAQPPQNGLEVVVVDNASTDGSQEAIKKQFPDVVLIQNKDNKGFSAANNQAVEKSSGKYLLFLNSDTKISKFALVKPLKYLKKHPDVGAVTVKLLLADGNIDPDNHRGFPTPWTALTHFTKLNKIFPNSSVFNQYFQSYKNFDSIHRIDVAAGSYLMMSRKLFDKLNGWDERYFFYGEDIDLSYRINQIGKKIVYYPKVEVIHYKGASSGLRSESKKIAKPPKANRVKVAQQSVKAMQLFYQKFYKDKYPRILTGIVILGVKLLGTIRVIKHKLT